MPRKDTETEILTVKEKLAYLHGFVLGLACGHRERPKETIKSESYFDLEYYLIQKLGLNDELIETDYIEKLKEFDLITMYRNI